MIQKGGKMLLLRSAGTRLLLLLKEDYCTSEEPPGQDSNGSRGNHIHPERVKSDDDFHARERP